MTSASDLAATYKRLPSRIRQGQAIIAAAALLALCKFILPESLIRPPGWLVWPFADWINWLFVFIKDDLGFFYVTRAFASVVEWLLDVTANLLYGRNRWPRIGPLPWTFIAITAAMIGYWLNGWRLAAVFRRHFCMDRGHGPVEMGHGNIVRDCRCGPHRCGRRIAARDRRLAAPVV